MKIPVFAIREYTLSDGRYRIVYYVGSCRHPNVIADSRDSAPQYPAPKTRRVKPLEKEEL